MSVAALIADLINAGVAPELVGRVADALANNVTPVLVRDDQAERRREKDRERQRIRRHPQTSAESADPSPKTKGSPEPLLKTQPSSMAPSPPKGGSVPKLVWAKPDDFARFWEAYPRKQAKAAAEKAFPKAISQIGCLEHDPLMVILGALERAKATWEDPKFIPHPASWLNNRRWEDEALQPTGLTDVRRSPPTSDAFARRQANMARALAASQGVYRTE